MKKFIALVIALSVVSLAIAFPFVVHAEETSGAMTKQEYYAAQSWLISEWCDGKITYDGYKTQSESVTNRFIEENSVGTVPDAILTEYNNAVNTTRAIGTKIGDTVEKYGNAAADYVKDAVSDLFGDYKTSEQVSTTDMKGYGAKLERWTKSGKINFEYYCDYIVTDLDSLGYIYYSLYSPNGDGATYWNGSYDCSFSFSSCTTQNLTDSFYWKVYGDVRSSDGTQSSTDDEYVTTTKYDFTQKPDPENPDNTIPTTEQELAELLDEINEELERLNPDLTSTDEILKSIYYRLGELDSDDDGAKLDTINASIIALMNSNSNQEIIDTLLEMRDYLKDGMSGTNGTGADEHKVSGTLYNVKPLDKSWINNITSDKTELKVEYEGKTYYLESDGCLKLGDKFYHVDLNYDSYTDIDFDFSNENVYIDESKYVDVDFENYGKMWANLSNTQKKKLNSITELISKLLSQGIPYSAVTGGLTFYQDIIFNSHEPKDIVLDLEFGGQEYSFTILSTSFFGEQGAQALQIMKNFISIVTCYFWLLSMRRETASMMR